MLSPANMRGSVAAFLCLCRHREGGLCLRLPDGGRRPHQLRLLPAAGESLSEALQFLFWGERSNDLLKARIAAERIPKRMKF